MITIGLLLSLNLSNATAQARLAPISATLTVDHSDAISNALAYLQTKQLPNGGIEGWVPGAADDFTTIKTVIALAAVHRPVNLLTSISGTTPLDYLVAQAITYTHDASGTLFPGRAGMLIVAAVAGDNDPTDFGGMNLIHELTAAYNAATGAYSTTAAQGFATGAVNTTNQLWAILGLAAAQETMPISATDFLVGLQEPDGGWGWGGGFGDVDTTALVIQALVASDSAETARAQVQEGLGFLRNTQAASGGWESWAQSRRGLRSYGGSLSADSTAAVIQAVAAAGYTPATESWAAAGGRTPHDDLLSLQAPDGSFGYNALSTAHAIAGLAEAPLPIFGRVQRANRALTWMNEQQNGDGSWSLFGFPDPGATCDAVLAYAAAGFDPASVMAPGSITSAMDYFSATASSFVTRSADSAGKLALAVESAGGDARDFGGVDIVRVLTETWYSPTLSGFGIPTNTWHQAWAILGLAAAGEPVPVSATQTLAGLQQADGGWKYDLTAAWWNTTGPDNTGLALQALIAAGVAPTDTHVVSGVSFLQNQQNAQGSWSAWGGPNANSTAYAMQGLLATGEDLEAAKWLKGNHNPYAGLAAFQKADGPFAQGGADNSLATWQAVPALMGVHYPFSHALKAFTGVNRGLDPDRMVVAPPRASWGNADVLCPSVDVLIPFGSDLDADGSVALDWRIAGETVWVTGTMVYRNDGYYTATLSLTNPVAADVLRPYEFQVAFADPDGVQSGSGITDTATLNTVLEPHTIYLPLVLRS